ncbi:MAG: DUF2264 domain-containing protein, partial [Acidobacteriota bacterium]|nr:DUF2264 domain-containing protein [Acidobacteriota bacterium]
MVFENQKLGIGRAMGRREILKSVAALGALNSVRSSQNAVASTVIQGDREYWVDILTRVAGPVLHALSARKLKAEMPVEAPRGNAVERRQFTYLEAMGRLLAGIAPWLEGRGADAREERMRQQYAEL